MQTIPFEEESERYKSPSRASLRMRYGRAPSGSRTNCAIWKVFVSLPDYDVPEHFMILRVGLLIIYLVVEPREPVKYEEERRVGPRDCGHSQGPPLLYQIDAALAAIQHGTCGHDGWDSGDQRSEASLCLPYAEAVMVVKAVWLPLYLRRLLVPQ